ncbi:MAG: hypothetical protein U9N86_19195 [Bacteroidota bacterium]|nr:hypothetical protein [Bacteroidota bacterium]
MRGLSILLCLMLSGTAAIAQNTKILTAWNSMKQNYNDLEKAKEAIDAAAIHPKTQDRAKTWYLRGNCYHKQYQSTNAKFKNLDPNPLKEAYLSYVMAKNLDTKHTYDDIEFKLALIGTEIFNKASAEFEQKKFRKALESFEMVMDIGALPWINKVDTGAVFYAAIAADQAGLYDKALSYYARTIDLKISGSDVYHYVAEVLMAKGDTVQAIKSYKDGIIDYPDDNGYLYIMLINHYLRREEPEKVAEYVEPAVKKYPKNASLWNVYGLAFEGTDQPKAVTGFINAIGQDSTFFEPFYNLGTLYYNQGVDANSVAMVIPLEKKAEYNSAITRRNEFFEMALPYYERAVDIDSNSGDLLIALKEIYIRLQMPEKLADVTMLIDELR